jgi:hypothetical protein
MLLFIYSLMLNKVVRFICWILLNKSFVDLFYWYYLDNKYVLPHLLYLLVLLVILSKLYLLWFLKARCMHILFMLNFVSYFLSLIQYIIYIIYIPSNPKWLRCAWNSNFISNYAHIYMESIICIVVILTTLDPISLGTKMYLNVVLGTLEMQWMLVSFIRKVLSAYDYWRQARIIGELLSTTSYHCYLGNKYNFHAYFSSIPTLVGWLLAW